MVPTTDVIGDGEGGEANQLATPSRFQRNRATGERSIPVRRSDLQGSDHLDRGRVAHDDDAGAALRVRSRSLNTSSNGLSARRLGWNINGDRRQRRIGSFLLAGRQVGVGFISGRGVGIEATMIAVSVGEAK